MKIYGPYMDSTGKRRIVIRVNDDGVRKTMSNARYVLEQKLDRSLESWEEADHIDGNPLNDDPSNLQPLSQLENIRKSSKPTERYEFKCPVCGEKANKPASKVRHNRKQGKSGPYCSRRCAGRVAQ